MAFRKKLAQRKLPRERVGRQEQPGRADFVGMREKIFETRAVLRAPPSCSETAPMGALPPGPPARSPGRRAMRLGMGRGRSATERSDRLLLPRRRPNRLRCPKCSRRSSCRKPAPRRAHAPRSPPSSRRAQRWQRAPGHKLPHRKFGRTRVVVSVFRNIQENGKMRCWTDRLYSWAQTDAQAKSCRFYPVRQLHARLRLEIDRSECGQSHNSRAASALSLFAAANISGATDL